MGLVIGFNGCLPVFVLANTPLSSTYFGLAQLLLFLELFVEKPKRHNLAFLLAVGVPLKADIMVFVI